MTGLRRHRHIAIHGRRFSAGVLLLAAIALPFLFKIGYAQPGAQSGPILSQARDPDLIAVEEALRGLKTTCKKPCSPFIDQAQQALTRLKQHQATPASSIEEAKPTGGANSEATENGPIVVQPLGEVPQKSVPVQNSSSNGPTSADSANAHREGQASGEEKRGLSFYLPFGALGICVLSLVAMVLLRSSALAKIERTRNGIDQLDGKVKGLQAQSPQPANLQQRRSVVAKEVDKNVVRPRKPVVNYPPLATTFVAPQSLATPKDSPRLEDPEQPPAPRKIESTGNSFEDYNLARAMGELDGEDWFHLHHTCRGLSCKNLDDWHLDPAAKLFFEPSPRGVFESVQEGGQTLVFPSFGVDYGPARGSLEGIFEYPESGSATRLSRPATVDSSGDRFVLRRPGAFANG